MKPLILKLIYPEKIALAPGEKAEFKAKISNPGAGTLEAGLKLRVPDRWSINTDEFSLAAPSGAEIEIHFEITAPKSGRSVAKNNLDFGFTLGENTFSVSAGLVRTIEFLRISQKYDSEICPPEDLFKNAEVISAAQHFQELPEGEQLYLTEIRPCVQHFKAILAAQGTRPVKAWLDGKLIIEHDGCEYVPAFHRSDYVSIIESLTPDWHRLIIWTGVKSENPTFEKQPKNAWVPVPDSVPLIEQRLKYDRERLFGHEDGELFCSFASTSGYRWIEDMEWRVPKV